MKSLTVIFHNEIKEELIYEKKIKKTMLGIFAAGMVLFIGTAMAFAGSHRGGGHHRNIGNDGICGNRSVCAEENFCQNINGKRFMDTNNDGICDNCNTDSRDCRCGRGCNGQNYTDVDNDGICDNRTAKKAQVEGEASAAETKNNR